MTTPLKSPEEVIDAIGEVLKNKYPYLLDIMEEVKKTENGLVNLQLRVYNGVVTDVVGTDTWRKTYKQTKT